VNRRPELPRPARPWPQTPSQALLEELHALEWSALTPALCEAIRLLESEKFDQLTDAHIREIASYRAVDLEDETFFERAFSPGKEAAASLAFALRLGRDTVLDDLQRLRSALGCPCDPECAES
jgi:hypothetical protein